MVRGQSAWRSVTQWAGQHKGPRAEASMAYGAAIEQQFGLPVVYQDERLTTVQAERMLVEQANTSRAKRKKVIDKLAAVMILQNYLDGAGKQLF